MPRDRNQGDGSDWARGLREAAPYLGIGSSLAATVLLGSGLGYWADSRLGTEPWLLLLGGVLGIGVGLWQFYRTVSRK